MALLTTEDIEPFTPDKTPTERQALIDSAVALASYYAPCLTIEPVDPRVATIAKHVIIKAIKYDLDAEAAGVLTRQSEQLGPYGVTNYAHRSGTLFSPAQIDILRGLCGGTGSGGAYSVPLDIPDTLPGW